MKKKKIDNLINWLKQSREIAEKSGDYTREMTYSEVIKKIQSEMK